MSANEIKEMGIVLSSVDSKESDRNLCLLLENSGKIYATIKGVKKPKAKLAYASFPFNVGEYFLVKRGKNYVVTNCNYIDNFSTLSQDLNNYYAASAMLEIIKNASSEDDSSTKLFTTILKALNNLCYNNDINLISLLSKFLYEVESIIGFKITADNQYDINTTSYFDFVVGRLTNTPYELAVKLTADEACFFSFVINNNMETFDFKQKGYKNVLKSLILFYEDRIDEEIKIIKKFI